MILGLTVFLQPAQAEVGQLSFAWDDATPTDHDGFKVERKAGPTGTYAQIGTVGPTVLTYTDPSLSVGSVYCYRVRAYNAAGDSPYANEACGTVPAQVPGLVVAFAFSEGSGSTTADATGNGQVGILAGATWTSAGKYGTALTFPGTSNTVTVFNTALLDISGTGLTVEGWVNLAALSGRDEVLLGKGWTAGLLGAPPYQYGIEFSGSRQQVDLYLGFVGGVGGGPISLTPIVGGWTHIAFTYDGTLIRGYLDGVEQVAVPETRSLQARGVHLILGADPALGQPFVGSLDEIRLYSRALVPSEVQTDMATPIGVTLPLVLTVTPAGTGSGTVTSNPLGLDCGTVCAASFAEGTPVALTATPAPGSNFAGWSGDCTGTGSCNVAMTQVRNVTATFTAQTVSLTVTKNGTGAGTVTSSPAGIDCGSTCSASFTFTSSVTLTATPAVGSTFTGWSGACTGIGGCSVTMDAAKGVGASFIVQTFALTVNKVGSGSVTSSPAGIDCGATCSAAYDYNTVVTLTATPALGTSFAGWSGACAGIGVCSVTLTAAANVTATFIPQSFTLTLTKAGAGVGSVTSTPTGIDCGSTCTGTYDYSTVVTLTATPTAGSTFTGWSGACTGTGACSVSLTAATNVTATFAPPPPPRNLRVLRDGL